MSQARLSILSLLLFTVLSGCSSSEELPPERAGIVSSLQTTMTDPGSYESVKWMQFPYQQKHIDIRNGVQLMMTVQGEEEELTRAKEQISIAAEADKAALQRSYEQRIRRNDSLRTVAKNLLAADDTSKIGTALYHVYRARKSTGEVVTDTVGAIMLAATPNIQYPMLTYDLIENIRLR